MISLLLLCVALDVVRELCFKTGARASLAKAGPDGDGIPAKASLGRAAAWSAAGGVIWIIEILCWAAVLTALPMTTALPIMSLTYAATPLAGALWLDEEISRRRWAGIGLVTAGVMIVGAAGIG